jgi:hypothetical protein
MFLCFILRSMIHFELIFPWGIRFIDFFSCVWLSNCFTTICWKDYSFLWKFFCNFSGKLHSCELFLSPFNSIDLYNTLPFHKHHTTLIAEILSYALKSSSVSIPNLFFFFRLVLYSSYFAYPYILGSGCRCVYRILLIYWLKLP